VYEAASEEKTKARLNVALIRLLERSRDTYNLVSLWHNLMKGNLP